jgi:hypothetical protein
MKNKKIIEAFDQMLPEEERHEKNLEQIISRLEAQGFKGEALPSEKDKENETGKNHKTNTSIKMLKRITAVAAALIAAIGIMFATNSEALAGVLNWFRHEKEDDPKSYVYEFKEEYSNKKIPQIIIGWLPEDFEGIKPQIGAIDNDYTYSRAYETKEGRRIDLLIGHMDKERKIYIVAEIDEELRLEELMIKGKEAEFCWDSETNYLNVFDDSTEMFIQIVANVEKDEMIKIAENIQFVFE